MSGFSTWAAMGGYAVFVWPAYGFALAVLGGMAALSWRRYRASVRDLERLQRRPAGLRPTRLRPGQRR